MPRCSVYIRWFSLATRSRSTASCSACARRRAKRSVISAAANVSSTPTPRDDPRQAVEERAAERFPGRDDQREGAVAERHHLRGLTAGDREVPQARQQQLRVAARATEVERVVQIGEARATRDPRAPVGGQQAFGIGGEAVPNPGDRVQVTQRRCLGAEDSGDAQQRASLRAVKNCCACCGSDASTGAAPTTAVGVG